MIAPPDPPLSGGGVALRPPSRDDLAALARICSDPDVQRYTLAPGDEPGVRVWIERREDGWRDGSGGSFVISDASGEVVGWIGAWFLADGIAQIAYAVGPDARGRGIATQALRLVVAWLFRETSCEQLQLLTHIGNRPSERVAAKAGFRAEGVLRSYLSQRGERQDVTMHGLLRSDLRGPVL